LLTKANPIIAEVFNNYISNAIKYAADGEKIIIAGKTVKGFLNIEVQDFGKTIRKEDRALIFIRKYQIESSNQRGRGLGLAIVKRIAEAHNAEVGIIPNKPKGNNFYLKILKNDL
ncbi:MAG: sensor histidine kinase, partial [Candidatus Marinimicrobia bacterium]|nr:sensor histidine kinase [Candidatus Neomarinimicrobiota bacterium]